MITSATGAPLPGCVWAYLAAYRGQEKECREIVETTISLAEQRGEGFDIDGALYSVAILHLGLSQYPEALAAASSARQHDDVGVQTHILNELVEAAARCGERSIAKDAADELQQQAQVCGTDTALGMAARAVALVSDGPAADAEYRPRSIIYSEARSPCIYRGRISSTVSGCVARNAAPRRACNCEPLTTRSCRCAPRALPTEPSAN